MTHDDKLKAHIEALERAGYAIRKKTVKTKTHTFVIDVELLNRFKECAKQRSVSIRQALHEALVDWINKKTK